uniref:DEAD/DEAH box helicase domain-containing protein n=1 Tax=Plectus sambesii TaxID=2011161 RepID=A0A914VNS9_9BILA
MFTAERLAEQTDGAANTRDEQPDSIMKLSRSVKVAGMHLSPPDLIRSPLLSAPRTGPAVQSLRHELLQYKSGEVQPSAVAMALTGGDRRELDELRERTSNLEAANMKLQTRLAEAVADRARMFSQMANLEDNRDHLTQVIESVRRLIEEKKEQAEEESMPSEQRNWQQHLLSELEGVLPSHADVTRDLNDGSFEATKKEDDTDGDDTEVDEQFPSRFVEMQSALSREMEDLLNQIREKERLIEQTAANHEIMNKMRAQHEQDMVDLQSKIDNIQHERDQLAEQLRRVSNSTKVSEERRKRLQELEKELANHRKTMQELKRLEKLKSQDADAIQKMRTEILVRHCLFLIVRNAQAPVTLGNEANESANGEAAAKRKFDEERQTLHEHHARLEREHQETVAFLIALISRLAKGGAMSTHELDKLMQLSAESESRQKLLAELADSESRNSQLSNELNKAKVNPNKQRLFRSVVSTSDLKAELPAARQTRSQRWSRPVHRLGMVSSSLLPDDSTNDEELNDDSSQETPVKPPKRSIHHIHCKCKTQCNSLCGCAKRKESCKAACGCPSDCANREKDSYNPADRRGTFTVAQQNESNDSEMPDENASTAMNQTFCLKTDSSTGSDNSDTKSPIHTTLLASQKRLTTGRRPGYFKPVFDDKDTCQGTMRVDAGSLGLPSALVDSYANGGLRRLFPWQAECLSLDGVLNGHNLVYSAPTSAGKTLVAELITLKRTLETKKKALFILPYVSVAREKLLALQKVFRSVGLKVDGYIGASTPTTGLDRWSAAVCTIEKANGLINRIIDDNALNDIGKLL